MDYCINPEQEVVVPDFGTYYLDFDDDPYPPGWYWESLQSNKDGSMKSCGDVTGPFITEAKAVADAREWLSVKKVNVREDAQKKHTITITILIIIGILTAVNVVLLIRSL